MYCNVENVHIEHSYITLLVLYVQWYMINAFVFCQQVVDVLNNILEENNLNGWMDLQEVSRLVVCEVSATCH